MTNDATRARPAQSIELQEAADLQGHLIAAINDLQRLQGLLTDACDTLMERFVDATVQLRALQAVVQGEQVDRLVADFGGSVTSLQFHDMATQLIEHSRRRLRNCIDRIGVDAFPADDLDEGLVESAPINANPVTQAEMDAGSVELF